MSLGCDFALSLILGLQNVHAVLCHLFRCFDPRFKEKSYAIPPSSSEISTAVEKATQKAVYSVTNSSGATHRFFCQPQEELRTKKSEFVHFGPNTSEVKSDWELMRKALWKANATLLFTAKYCSFSSPKRRPKNFEKQAKKINILFTKPNVGLEC